MDFEIRKINIDDKAQILSMMREFYSSEAVLTNGSDEIFNADIENCINDNPYIEGYIFCSNQEILGYAMLAKSFSTEFGRHCIWFEDLYLKQQYRGHKIIPQFITYIKNKYRNHIFRLEAEKTNKHAVHVYKKYGFKEFEYTQFINFD